MIDRTPKPLWVLLPVKDFTRAKSRLAPILSQVERAALARRLCDHVLSTTARCAGIDGVLVLSDSPEVLALAQHHGRTGQREPDGVPRGPLLGAIIDDGLARLTAQGAQAALVLMSDLPLLASQDLDTLVDLLDDHDCVLAPDLREQNTNALALRLGHDLQTAFGSGDSFARHLDLAASLGLRTAVHRCRGLGFDIDFPADYSALPADADLLRRS